MKTISRIPQLPDPCSCSAEFVQHLHAALTTVGAAYIPVTGLIQDSNLLRTLQSLFTLEETQKRSLAQRLTPPWQGVFIALGEEQLEDGQEDHKEVLDINLANGTYAQWIAQRMTQRVTEQMTRQMTQQMTQQLSKDGRSNRLLSDRLLGDEAQMKVTESLCQIFHAFQTQANYVLAALETAYQQPPGSLVHQHGQNSTLRLLHYPIASHLRPGVVRLGCHQDYSGITLLWQDTTGGLEILTPEREWIGVEIPPGCIGVIASELMQRWSGATLHGAPHRVRVIHPDQANQARYSIAFFCETNHDCVVYPGALVAGTESRAENAIEVKAFLTKKYDQILSNLSF